MNHAMIDHDDMTDQMKTDSHDDVMDQMETGTES